MDCCKIITEELAKELLPKRVDDSNKGTYGTVLNFSGCKEYVGAAYLSSVAPLMVGAGLVELATPNYVADKVAAMCADIIYMDMKTHSYLETIPDNIDYSKYSSFIVGCGLGNNKYTKKFLNVFLEKIAKISKSKIYDADALNIIAEENITNLGENSIITPHPGEMARLLSINVADVQADRGQAVLSAAKKYNSVVVLKGHNTLVALPTGEIYKDILGTNALAKAGMGDVLAGIIAGFAAQGVGAETAAILGVYIHSQSGVYAEKDLTQYGVMASKLLDYIPYAIKSVIV